MNASLFRHTLPLLALVGCNELLSIEPHDERLPTGDGQGGESAGSSGALGSSGDVNVGGFGSGAVGGDAAGTAGFAGQPSPSHGGLTRVSVSTTGDESVSGSETPGASDDGRFVSFESMATNLVPDDWDNVRDVFVRDRIARTTTRVSLGFDKGRADASSFEPSISGSGRVIVFASEATNLVQPALTKGRRIFSATFELGGLPEITCLTPAEGVEAHRPVVSNDGKVVVFELNEDPPRPSALNTFPVIYRRDSLGNLRRISTSVSGSSTRGQEPAVNADGSVIVFNSYEANLVDNDTNGAGDIFVWRLETQKIERISVGTNGTQANGNSFEPSISADGRFVAFTSSATNLVFGDVNNEDDIFVHDLTTRETVRVSVVSSTQAEANGKSWGSSLSRNGRVVVFTSEARNLIPGQEHQTPAFEYSDVFLHDRDTHQTIRISVPVKESTQRSARSEKAIINASARLVAFTSGASDLVLDDTNERIDVFAFEFLEAPWL